MKLYHGKTLLQENADFAAFTRAYAQAVHEKSCVPFLLVRDDDYRLLVVTHESRIMLCTAKGYWWANGPANCSVSHESTYLEGIHSVVGLTKNHITVKDRSLIEPFFAIKAIQAFFNNKSMSDFVSFGSGMPEPEIMNFPSPFKAEEEIQQVRVEMQVTVTDELKADMQRVCEFLESKQLDRDGYFDSEDAIRIGSLCGERVDRRHNIFDFCYLQNNGDAWHFRAPRTVLDGIATGNITKLTVGVFVPKHK